MFYLYMYCTCSICNEGFGVKQSVYICIYIYVFMYILGCNNGIGGFHENLVTFERKKLPDFEWAQKMRLKNCSS